ncbi:MAG TPA: efflux RND transporter permease subunit [Terriglobales bacterium]|jgi:multidrug efflux pump subunit AcrB|nr:efflux RND transporter permease subunit [Terriglobales bacterium]
MADDALVFQFRHAVKPLIVFVAIPYGMVGVFFVLWLTGTPFGFMAFLGIASLVGVIVSHVIVLLDFIEEAHQRGETLREALLDAGIVRLRPVLITVGATVIALFSAGRARRAALGTVVLRANRRAMRSHSDHSATCTGALRDRGPGP